MADIPADLAATLAAVVDTGTMDAAARRLHVTPSAVSQRIRALEDRLGRVLLVRSNPARATADGERVVRLARQYALLAHDLFADADADADAAAPRTSLPLAVNADSMATWFVSALARVAAEHPVVFDLHRDDQDFTAELLESGRVVAAVTSRGTPIAGCRVTALGRMRYRAMATPEIAARCAAEGLDAAPVVDFDRRDDLQSRWLRARGIDPALPPRNYVPGSHDFADAVRSGLGWGMLPDLQSADAVRAGGLVALGGADLDVALFWQQWGVAVPVLDAVAEAVLAEARRVLLPPEPIR